MKTITIFILLGTIISCSTGPTKEPNFKVEYKGALKNIMHKADVSAKIELSELEETEFLYALGALENLKGEIQILDSKPYNTSVIDSNLIFDNSFDKKATLLVYASVSEWVSIKIPDHVVSYEQLENFINELAKKNNINTEESFPFLIEGTPESFDWHVINWKDGDTEHSHKKHITSGLNGTIKNKKVEMLGFYSNSHHAIFTHHTTNMHIHVKTVDNKIAGHVDGLTLGNGMVLKLPKTK
ncbi:acetolactate decarboxylase [Flavobacteriales bacterium]|nr:acetolactate decarboxylase [Flavobacteriales bacterium]